MIITDYANIIAASVVERLDALQEISDYHYKEALDIVEVLKIGHGAKYNNKLLWSNPIKYFEQMQLAKDEADRIRKDVDILLEIEPALDEDRLIRNALDKFKSDMDVYAARYIDIIKS